MTDFDDVWDRIQLGASEYAALDAFPIWTQQNEWETVGFDRPEQGILPHHGSWMVGDLPAILWFTATGPGAPEGASDRAFQWSTRLKNRTGVDLFASVSHMFFRGALVGATLSGNASLQGYAAEAADTVARRFESIGYMKSFGAPSDGQYPFTTIDDVINLALPLWHAVRSEDEALEQRLLKAARVIAALLVRSDGSVGQVLRMSGRGEPLAVDTYQGYSPEGCWSRGQAWGIYGYATLARMTGSPEFRDIADRLADYWIDRVQDDPSPLWDFMLPEGEPRIRDTFAASLALAGILELADLSASPRRTALVGYAQAQLKELADLYMIHESTIPGMLRGAALDVPHDHGIDSTVIVGDSYFTEAVWRVRSGVRGGVVPVLGTAK